MKRAIFLHDISHARRLYLAVLDETTGEISEFLMATPRVGEWAYMWTGPLKTERVLHACGKPHVWRSNDENVAGRAFAREDGCKFYKTREGMLRNLRK